MPLLRVANVHFEATGANRLEYLNSQVQFKTGGGNYTISVGGTESVNVGAGGVVVSGINVVPQIAAAFDKANTANTTAVAAFAKANTSVQNNATTLITVGYTITPFNAGANIASYGTWTPNAANSNYQYGTSNGSVTISAPAADCAIDFLLTNGVSAGSITFSGYTVQSGGTGDSYVTTNASKFILMIRRINGTSTYIWKALQ